MRKIILDTETTGLNNLSNKIIEIGAIETFDNLPSGEIFHVYINPMMYVDEACYQVCGLTNEFLKDKPLFKDIINSFSDFIGEDPIVAHNATFDVGFLNMERQSIGLAPLKNEVIDTLKIARKVFPGLPCSLDALCKRFKISLHKRSKHGALVDAELLTKVYFNLLQMQTFEYSLLDVEEDNILVEVNFSRDPLVIQDEMDIQEHLRFVETYLKI